MNLELAAVHLREGWRPRRPRPGGPAAAIDRTFHLAREPGHVERPLPPPPGQHADAPRSQQVRTSATVYLTVNSAWQYVAVPNPLGLRHNTVDIRGLYEHRHDDTAKRADVGIRYGGTDISNYFQPGGNGYDSGFRSGNSSLGSLFA